MLLPYPWSWLQPKTMLVSKGCAAGRARLIWVARALKWVMVSSEPEFLQRAMSVSMALLQPGSVLMSVAF